MADERFTRIEQYKLLAATRGIQHPHLALGQAKALQQAPIFHRTIDPSQLNWGTQLERFIDQSNGCGRKSVQPNTSRRRI
jgi:hypothetical protein